MRLTVNGESYEHKGDGTLMSLLSEMGAEPERVAVMVNEVVLDKTKYDSTSLKDSDAVEVLYFAGGG